MDCGGFTSNAKIEKKRDKWRNYLQFGSLAIFEEPEVLNRFDVSILQKQQLLLFVVHIRSEEKWEDGNPRIRELERMMGCNSCAL